MEFRIAQITDDPRGVLTGAFVFSPPPHLPDVPRVMVERFGAENTKLGLHGWAVDSKGLRPRVVEKRGAELWLCFGAEVSFHVLPNTPGADQHPRHRHRRHRDLAADPARQGAAGRHPRG